VKFNDFVHTLVKFLARADECKASVCYDQCRILAQWNLKLYLILILCRGQKLASDSKRCL
jgi:hypothetical protein